MTNSYKYEYVRNPRGISFPVLILKDNKNGVIQHVGLDLLEDVPYDTIAWRFPNESPNRINVSHLSDLINQSGMVILRDLSDTQVQFIAATRRIPEEELFQLRRLEIELEDSLPDYRKSG